MNNNKNNKILKEIDNKERERDIEREGERENEKIKP